MPRKAADRAGRAAGWLILAAFVLALDLATKRAAEALLADGWIRVTGFFNLVLAKNTGAAFSFLADSGGWQRVFFSAAAALISAAMTYVIVKSPDRRASCAGASLLLGGALGNLADRVLYGAVTDFLDFHLAGLHWPAFNIADIAIVAGAAILIFLELRRR